MTFTSYSYFFYLPLVFALFYLIADRWRWLLLLIASYTFYASFKAPYLIATLLLVTISSYYCGLRISAHQDESIRKRWLWCGSFISIAILVAIKILPLLVQAHSITGNFNSLFTQSIISVGVSYFAFQAISYLVDVYLEIEDAERHFGHFALYLAFFPKLLQGPIERANDLLPQLKNKYVFDYNNVRFGLLLFTWGIFKKIVIADRLGLIVDAVYNDVGSYTGSPLLLATYGYSLQIYMDFSGYTDMALGSAYLFNIKLTQNFNAPYLATSVSDFWRRWHISFSRWILDYIFKPLQMRWRNFKNWGLVASLLITFLISGIWHGMSFGFLIWGGLHGVYMACSSVYKPYQKKIHKALCVEKTEILRWWQVIITFNLVSFAWIFFRSNTIGDALYVLRHIGRHSIENASINVFDYSNLVIILASLLYYLIFVRHILSGTMLLNKYRWAYYIMHFMIIFYFGIANNKFIYFQF